MSAATALAGRAKVPPYTSVANEFLLRSGLTDKVIGFCTRLLGAAKGRDRLTLPDWRLALAFKCSRRTVQYGLKLAELAGVIERQRDYDNARNKTNRVIVFKGPLAAILEYRKARDADASTPQGPAPSTPQGPAPSTPQGPAISSLNEKEEEKKSGGSADRPEGPADPPDPEGENRPLAPEEMASAWPESIRRDVAEARRRREAREVSPLATLRRALPRRPLGRDETLRQIAAGQTAFPDERAARIDAGGLPGGFPFDGAPEVAPAPESRGQDEVG